MKQRRSALHAYERVKQRHGAVQCKPAEEGDRQAGEVVSSGWCVGAEREVGVRVRRERVAGGGCM